MFKNASFDKISEFLKNQNCYVVKQNFQYLQI